MAERPARRYRWSGISNEQYHALQEGRLTEAELARQSRAALETPAESSVCIDVSVLARVQHTDVASLHTPVAMMVLEFLDVRELGKLQFVSQAWCRLLNLDAADDLWADGLERDLNDLLRPGLTPKQSVAASLERRTGGDRFRRRWLEANAMDIMRRRIKVVSTYIPLILLAAAVLWLSWSCKSAMWAVANGYWVLAIKLGLAVLATGAYLESYSAFAPDRCLGWNISRLVATMLVACGWLLLDVAGLWWQPFRTPVEVVLARAAFIALVAVAPWFTVFTYFCKIVLKVHDMSDEVQRFILALVSVLLFYPLADHFLPWEQATPLLAHINMATPTVFQHSLRLVPWVMLWCFMVAGNWEPKAILPRLAFTAFHLFLFEGLSWAGYLNAPHFADHLEYAVLVIGFLASAYLCVDAALTGPTTPTLAVRSVLLTGVAFAVSWYVGSSVGSELVRLAWLVFLHVVRSVPFWAVPFALTVVRDAHPVVMATLAFLPETLFHILPHPDMPLFSVVEAFSSGFWANSGLGMLVSVVVVPVLLHAARLFPWVYGNPLLLLTLDQGSNPSWLPWMLGAGATELVVWWWDLYEWVPYTAALLIVASKVVFAFLLYRLQRNSQLVEPVAKFGASAVLGSMLIGVLYVSRQYESERVGFVYSQLLTVAEVALVVVLCVGLFVAAVNRDMLTRVHYAAAAGLASVVVVGEIWTDAADWPVPVGVTLAGGLLFVARMIAYVVGATTIAYLAGAFVMGACKGGGASSLLQEAKKQLAVVVAFVVVDALVSHVVLQRSPSEDVLEWANKVRMALFPEQFCSALEETAVRWSLDQGAVHGKT